jgi:hypothetical protein
MTRPLPPAVLLAVLFLTAGCLGFLSPEPESFASTYDYGVALSAYGTVTNVTVYAPLPVGPNGTVFDESTLASNGTTAPFEASVVDTEFGPMLALTADTFEVETRYYAVRERDGVGERVEISESEYDPENPDHQRVAFRSVDLTASLPEAYPVETREPIGTEPLLPAAGARVEAPCPVPTSDDAVCYRYDAPVYLFYEAESDVRVDLLVSFEGRNEWFAGGWTGNGYRDLVSVRAAGPQDGWTSGEGTLVTGDGNYRE